MEEFINNELDLELNQNKTKLFPIRQGVNVVGFKIFATHMNLRNRNKRKIERRLNSFSGLIMSGKMTIEKAGRW